MSYLRIIARMVLDTFGKTQINLVFLSLNRTFVAEKKML